MGGDYATNLESGMLKPLSPVERISNGDETELQKRR
jgi:hypothetical protein